MRRYHLSAPNRARNVCRLLLPRGANRRPTDRSTDGRYRAAEPAAERQWIERNGVAADPAKLNQPRDLPAAEVLGIQARSDFDRFDPMEVVATGREVDALLGQYPRRACPVFPEDRRYPIRMDHDRPLRWIAKGPSGEFREEAQRNEFYVFQIGAYAATEPVEDLVVTFANLCSRRAGVIPGSAFRCFNLGGTDGLGRAFSRALTVPRGRIQALWRGVQIPAQAAAGTCAGRVLLGPRRGSKTAVRLVLDISDKVLEDSGVGEVWRHSRLKWLDSAAGREDEATAPLRREIATYMMGLGAGRGGFRPKEVKWKWDDLPINKLWIGEVEAGLRCKLRGAAET